MLGEDLPPFADLGSEDCDVLQPLPHDGMLLGPESPYPGAPFAQGNRFCQHVLVAALENKEHSPLSTAGLPSTCTAE